MNENDGKTHTAVPDSGGGREALDADNIKKLKADPSDTDAQLDIDIDESFPASDPPSTTQPRKGRDGPAPGGKYD
ncbi:MAG: hypothetical protein Q7J32_02065 [Sphingomonadaceae bacterium]|nr:hypothetical protein [Sphingomonadaceae bacterium]